MAAVLQEFANLAAGERGLWAEAWIEGAEVRQKEVLAVLTPPLCGVGFVPTESAPRVGKPHVIVLRIRVEYDLAAYDPSGTQAAADSRYALPQQAESESRVSRRLASSQCLSDLALSPDRFPARRPATVKSSSTPGQWTYAPSPKTSK